MDILIASRYQIFFRKLRTHAKVSSATADVTGVKSRNNRTMENIEAYSKSAVSSTYHAISIICTLAD
ncbi:hypothetical protein CHS0354_002758 [Potamilus streckersoni]|uniref:Uncharacterized protein n=1 Tax=Potamilus streckersoni TaxID=2493646 RepID=A0AAE0W574_9BIVA|nr:hypothetical protein CHS0354_002758 [Potamilus streckersoni]